MMNKKGDKLRNYNQVLLAIGGTLILLFMLIFGSWGMYEEFGYLFRDERRQLHNGIIAAEETEELLKDSLRKQIISFKTITLLDSANKTYVLPVRQADLFEGESVKEILGLINTTSRSYYDAKNFSPHAFNNLVVYNSVENSSEIIFSERISITSYEVLKRNSEIYILVIGTNKDSNKDGYLNDNDLQELFIYELKKDQLTKINFEENFTTFQINEQEKTKDIIGRFGLDRNNNGEFEIGREPMMIYRIDLAGKKLIKLLTNDQINQLQKLLEGR